MCFGHLILFQLPPANSPSFLFLQDQIKRAIMFQHSISRNGRNKESKVKRVLHAALLLAVVIWLLHQITKRDDSGSEEIKLKVEDVDVDIGRKGKAGSENVIIFDGSKGSFGMSETSEAEDQSDVSQNPENDEESNDKGQENSQELALNDGKTLTQEDQVSNNDNDPDANAVGQDEAKDNGADDDHEGILKLPSERSSSDQNEGESRKDEQTELVTVDGIKNVTEETITSDQEAVLTSQLDGGEESEVEKVTIDFRGATEPDNGNGGEESEAEKVTIDSQATTEPETENGGEISMEDSTNNANSDDEHGNPSLPNEDSTDVSNTNEGSGNANFNSENDNAIDSETSDQHVAETVNSDPKLEEEVVNHSDSTENEVPKGEVIESTSLNESTEDSTDNDVPEREAIERTSEDSTDNEVSKREEIESTSSSESTADRPSVEESMKTSLADNKVEGTELFENNENIENDSDESHDDDASGAETTISIDVEAEKRDTEPKPDSTESHSDGSSRTENVGDNSRAETSEETKISDDTSNSNEETPNIESTESQGDNASDRDLKTEESHNTEISAE